jgi:hypothetical protein
VLLENIIPLTENENTEVPHYECPFLTKELWISATGKFLLVVLLIISENH